MAHPVASSSSLPIERVLPTLRDALDERSSAVLEAPPGAGKTTRVPLALLESPWLSGQRIIMLEPRRLAARAAARRMASSLGESVGGLVGFRVRGETRVNRSTRIEVVTEGVLTRMLLSDPTLIGTGLVIFDEFHERSVHADLGLALTLQTQTVLRPELRVLVMSATLDGSAVAKVLGGAPVVRTEGRAHPVEIQHLPRADQRRAEDVVASLVRVALRQEAGSVLAFLPGAAEIRRCAAALGRDVPSDVEVLPLYGDLPAESQDRAISPAPPGRRKVVLATSIAETSLTIDGVRVVVDGGLSRVPRFSPRSGMMRLDTVRVSRASADQRAGRAGRTAPGVCFRAWTVEEEAGLSVRGVPEILEADLAPLALDLAMAGVTDPLELRWMDAPPVAAMSQARELLLELGALSADGRITAHGRAMSEFGLHPRVSHMLLTAGERGMAATACVVAALLQERDIMRRDTGQRDVDLRSRVGVAIERGAMRSPSVDADALRRVRETMSQLRAQLRVSASESAHDEEAGACLALAYPDRVAIRRGGDGNRHLLRNGVGAVLEDPGTLADSDFLCAAELDGRSPQARIYLAAPLERSAVEALFANDIVREDVVAWDASTEAIVAVRRERLGAIVLHEARLTSLDSSVIAAVVLRAIQSGELALPLVPTARALVERIAFVRQLDAGFPDLSESALLADGGAWLLPHLGRVRRRDDLERLDLASIIMERLDWSQRKTLDAFAPTHVVVPTGSRLPVDYSSAESPVLAVRLQELFGLAETPRIGGGKVPLTLHLLSPAHRPVQVTRDLGGFWRSSYFEVRKDLRGRYPRHEWPEDPLSAVPTKRAKPRR